MGDPYYARRNPTIDVRLALDLVGQGLVMLTDGNRIAFPGGCAYSGATLLQSAYALAKEQTGLDVKGFNAVSYPLWVDSDPSRQPEHRITLFYHAWGEGTPRGDNLQVIPTGDIRDISHHHPDRFTHPLEATVSRMLYTNERFTHGVMHGFVHPLSIISAPVDRTTSPIPTTDLIVNYKEGVLLIDRGHPPAGLALPGGHAELGLTLQENAVKEGHEETGLEVELIGDADANLTYPFCIMDDPNRDPREAQRISFAYLARASGTLTPGPHDDAKEVRRYSVAEACALIAQQKAGAQIFAFADHHLILERGLDVRWVWSRRNA